MFQMQGFLVNENGVLINKKILDGDRFPSVRYYVLLADDDNIEAYQLSKREISNVMAENLKKYVGKNHALPNNCTIVRIQKGKAVVKYFPTKYDIFTLYAVLPEEITGIAVKSEKREKKGTNISITQFF